MRACVCTWGGGGQVQEGVPETQERGPAAALRQSLYSVGRVRLACSLCSLARFARLLTCSLTTTHSPLTHSPLTHSLPPLPPPSPPRVLRVPPPARATMTSSSRKLRLHRRGFAIVSLAPPALPTTRPMQSAAAHQASEHACAVMKGVVVVVVMAAVGGGGGGCGGVGGGGAVRWPWRWRACCEVYDCATVESAEWCCLRCTTCPPPVRPLPHTRAFL